MSGLFTRYMGPLLIHKGAGPVIDFRTRMADTIRQTVEGQQSLALDAKADREALIRDLIEALC